MKKNKNNYSGFTLVELLLAMGILAFLIAAGVTFSTNFNQRQAINIAYDNLHTALAQAKSFSLSQVTKNCNLSIDATEKANGIVSDELVGYQVEFDITTNPDKHTYAVYEICIDGSSGLEKTIDNGFDNPAVSEYSLPSGILFRGTPADIRFKVLTGGATSSQTITIETENQDQVRAIRVNTSGVISDASP